jgi:hypothetical protein
MDTGQEAFGLFFGTDKMAQLDKAFEELKLLDIKYKNDFTDNDQLSFYYTIHFTNDISLVWQKGGPSDNIKQEIIAIMDKYFQR